MFVAVWRPKSTKTLTNNLQKSIALCLCEARPHGTLLKLQDKMFFDQLQPIDRSEHLSAHSLGRTKLTPKHVMKYVK